jgi:hypothetical protein
MLHRRLAYQCRQQGGQGVDSDQHPQRGEDYW